MIRFPRTWPGADKQLWPALNKLADTLEKVANSQTDGSIVWNLDEGTMYVPEPEEFEAVILAGTNPYCWAKVRSDASGAWYAMNAEEGSEIGNAADYAVTTVQSATWNGGVVAFILDDDIPISAGDTIGIYKVEPSGYDGVYTALSATDGVFTATLASDPGTYVAGGAAVKTQSGNAAFREGYERNSNILVPQGAIVWIKPRYTTSGDETDQEYKFTYQYPGAIPAEPLRPTFIPGYDGEDGDSYCIPGIPGERGPAGATGATGQGTAVPPGDKCEHDVWFGPWTPPGRNIACKLTGGTNTAVSPASTVSIQFETEVYDYDGMFVSTTNTRITIRTPGNYWVWGRARSSLGAVAPTAGGYQRLMLYKNGAATDFFQSGASFLQDGSGDAYYCHLQVCEEDVCAAGDYFELFWKNGDASTNINIDKGNFGARKVDGAALPN